MKFLTDTHAFLWFVTDSPLLSRKAKPFAQFIPEQLARNGFQILHLTVEHTARVAMLPLHHCDPFDRMLVVISFAPGESRVRMKSAKY